MSVGSKGSSLVAHVEDAADEDAEEGIMSTRKYATSVAQHKERPNTSRSRADKRPAQSAAAAAAAAAVTDSDSTARASDRKPRDGRRQSALRDAIVADRDRGHSRRDKTPRDDVRPQRIRTESAAAKDRESSRPPQRKPRPSAPKHAATQPLVQQGGYAKQCAEDPAYYGVKQTVHAAPRPRAQSYYAGHHGQPPPPLGPSSWYTGHHMPSPAPIGSFPPAPVWSGLPPQPGYGPPLPHSPGGPPPGYFDSFASSPTRHSHLRSRFESRAPSPMGFRPPPAVHDYRSEDYADDAVPMALRARSRTRRPEDDSARMPPPLIPPKRPQSAVPQVSSFRPPAGVRHASRQTHSRPPPLHRKSVNYDDVAQFDDDGHDSLDEDGQSLFNDNSPNSCIDRRRVASRPRRGSLMYSHPDCDLIPATGRGRRSSLYSSSPLATGDGSLGESKLDAAIKYQEEAAGANKVPLTAEALRKAMKRGGVASSRSTRSSDSPDDSEYKRSNTTGITQASHDNEYTIRVPGNAVVRLQGAEIECPNEGGEISWSMRRSGSRPGSDRASSMYQSQVEESRRIEDGRRSDDSRSRIERQALPHRPRAPSQSDSQSRGYGPTYAPYERYGYM
ncbi:hypothetical protein CDD81_4075 [Ophiocordyceps australis]|uniref:Uncharacterized protein n=1 Tax=Ophiocordyceps australis TaxID=1399860 RepID=A0A2C5XU21_9HYPO|nr:hypothetical protein CDD81_4075 [Ophiocordyceps australis]